MPVYFQKKIRTGLFGGEGFIVQKLSDEGTAFVEIDGYCVEDVFLTKATGPGKIILQTMTLSGFVGALRPMLEKGNK